MFNDLYYPYLHKPTADRMLDREPTSLLNRFDTHAFPGSLFARSYAAHQTIFLGRRALRKLTGHPFFSFERRDDFYLAWTPHGWDATTPCFPVVEQVDDAYRALDLDRVLYPQRRIGAICASIAVACLDLTESLHAAGGKALYRDYVRLNGKGNDVVAAGITRFLRIDSNLKLAD